MARQSKAEKLEDARIESLFREGCNGVQIPIMKIGAVFDAGRKAIRAGGDDAAVKAAIVEFVNTIKAN